MPVRIGSGLSTHPDARAGAEEAAATAGAALGGAGCDLAIVFAAGAHLAAPEATLEAVHETLAPADLIGCGAGGVLGGGREVEGGTAVAVWAASFGSGGGSARPFHSVVSNEEGRTLAGIPDLEGAAGAVILADPMSFPADPILRAISELLPDVPVLGGIASARLGDGGAALFLGDEVVESGAVGVRFDGVTFEPCVSQGAAPLGPELTITAAEGNVILELAGKPAYEKVQEVIGGLAAEERAMLAQAGGVLIGIVVDPNKPDYVQGDFLVRPLLGADRRTGAVAVGALVRVGQVVRLQVRDAASADRDLRRALGERRDALAPSAPAGALVFACNGRGRSMFGTPDHDAAAVADALAGAPAAGFFAAGEIGPVGGECHLHGFTATVAVFGA
jgi:small ligand-binding sensory domain FIST